MVYKREKNNMTNPTMDSLQRKCWHNEYGQLHREDGPAVEYTSDVTLYPYRHGNGLKIEYYKGHKEYYINGKHIQ
jgi:hypothetical protein